MSILTRAHRLRDAYKAMVNICPSLAGGGDDPIKAGHDVADALIRIAPMLEIVINELMARVNWYGTYEPEQWPHVEEARKLLAELKAEGA